MFGTLNLPKLATLIKTRNLKKIWKSISARFSVTVWAPKGGSSPLFNAAVHLIGLSVARVVSATQNPCRTRPRLCRKNLFVLCGTTCVFTCFAKFFVPQNFINATHF